MRKVVLDAAVTLDNYIAGPGGDLGWLRWCDEAGERAKSLWDGVDTLLMGRRTYEFAASKASGDEDPGGISTYVFSTTMREAPKGAELIRDDAGAFVRALKSRPGGKIWLMGGGVLASSLIEAGVVDEVGLNIHPVVLGDGAPLFGGVRTDLSLKSCKATANGCILAAYELA